MSSTHPMPPRVPTGISALDNAIEGGLPRNRVVLITGNTGAGKTTMAMQFLAEGFRSGEGGIFIALDQKPSHVEEAAARFGWPISTSATSPILLLDGSPALSLMKQRQHSVDARAVMADLIPHVRARGARRLVIDSLTALLPPELSESEEETFFRDLVFALEDNIDCTTLAVAADEDERSARVTSVASRLVTGVIDLRAREDTGRLRRHLLVKKMRATDTDTWEREFEIGAAGVVVTTERQA
jgi:circadian clock protein KaiC